MISPISINTPQIQFNKQNITFKATPLGGKKVAKVIAETVTGEASTVANSVTQHVSLLQRNQELDAKLLEIQEIEIGLHRRRAELLGGQIESQQRYTQALETTLDAYRQRVAELEQASLTSTEQKATSTVAVPSPQDAKVDLVTTIADLEEMVGGFETEAKVDPKKALDILRERLIRIKQNLMPSSPDSLS